MTVLPVPFEFVLFGLTLLGVALFHRHTLPIALLGLGTILGYKLLVTGFPGGPGVPGLAAHFGHEWVVLANLFLLLTGFGLLSRHFELSGMPDVMPNLLPDSWLGGLLLLGIVFVLSAFLDNIAAALIGGTVARHVFKGEVHLTYLVAIVAAANAGGAGSPIGDTTTTMMWIDGVHPGRLVEATVGAAVAFLIFAIPAALRQHRHAPIVKHAPRGLTVDWPRIGIAGAILIAAILANTIGHLLGGKVLESFPLIGVTVWAVLLAAAPIRRPDLAVLPEALKGTVFLLALVAAASLMPVNALPAASWPTALALGFVSSVFDNIPLTALALRQGGQDWGFLAYAVGFGGSMIWFGSSAGVAISNLYPEAKSVTRWVRHGWSIPLAFVTGFLVMYTLLGWRPDPPHRDSIGSLTDSSGLFRPAQSHRAAAFDVGHSGEPLSFVQPVPNRRRPIVPLAFFGVALY